MVKDILVPSKIGNSYLFSKKVLSFEITQIAVHALLINCKGDAVVIQNKMSIALKDFSVLSVISAIKKIVSTIGKYDEIVTALPSNFVVFKELRLPFLGYEKLEMIMAYEVEPLLPFALDQAVIDFVVVDENLAARSSTVLVAAALKKDVDEQVSLFEKAGVVLSLMTVDMFSLYAFYKYALYADSSAPKISLKNKLLSFFKKVDPNNRLTFKNSTGFSANDNSVDVFVDIGYQGMNILYMASGILKGVRAVPCGVSDIAQMVSKKLDLSYYDVMQHVMHKENSEVYEESMQKEFDLLFEHIARTLSFFENQIKHEYKAPQRIVFSGLGSSLTNFTESARNFFDMPVVILNIETFLTALHITSLDKKPFSVSSVSNLATVIFGKYNDSCNLLKSFANKNDNILLSKQLGMIILLTVAAIGGVLWHSLSELQRWDRAYVTSKKELTTALQTTMGIDVKSERNLKDVVTKAEATLKNEHKLWFSFSKQTEQSYLKYLQDLSVHIDREAIGLDVKKLVMRPDLVTITGALRGNPSYDLEDGFAALPVFKEELSELTYLQLVEEARSPELFTIQLKIKDKGSHDTD